MPRDQLKIMLNLVVSDFNLKDISQDLFDDLFVSGAGVEGGVKLLTAFQINNLLKFDAIYFLEFNLLFARLDVYHDELAKLDNVFEKKVFIAGVINKVNIAPTDMPVCINIDEVVAFFMANSGVDSACKKNQFLKKINWIHDHVWVVALSYVGSDIVVNYLEAEEDLLNLIGLYFFNNHYLLPSSVSIQFKLVSGIVNQVAEKNIVYTVFGSTDLDCSRLARVSFDSNSFSKLTDFMDENEVMTGANSSNIGRRQSGQSFFNYSSARAYALLEKRYASGGAAIALPSDSAKKHHRHHNCLYLKPVGSSAEAVVNPDVADKKDDCSL